MIYNADTLNSNNSSKLFSFTNTNARLAINIAANML